MPSVRRFVIAVLERIFRVVKIPSTFSDALRLHPRPILVAPSSSVVIEALIKSLARRSGVETVLHARNTEQTGADQNGTTSAQNMQQTLRWLSIHDNEVLERVWKADPTARFSTLSIFHVRGPVRNPPQRRPGFFWNLSLLFARRTLYIRCGTPLVLEAPTALRNIRALKVDFYKNLKIVRGTPFQPLETQEHIILSGHEFEREIRILSERAGESIAHTREKARRAFYDIAAHPKRPWYYILSLVAKLISRRLFTAVVISGIERLEPAVKEQPVVIVPLHRSHLDYILLGSELYRLGFNPPLVAAGINLRFWPVGYMIRSVGGYFVKRNARDRLHALILRRYVAYLIKRGHLQEFFLEGGRSRSGKMMQPKLGLLSIILDAFSRGIRREILFVPVSITYENLIEDEVFAKENTGLSKTKENLLSLLRAFDIFRKKYGEVIINFGSPIALSEFLASQTAPPAESVAPASKPARSDYRGHAHTLGMALTRAIRDQINPSLTALAYTALMNAPAYGLPREMLVQSVANLARLITVMRRLNPAIGEFTPALEKFLSGREHIVLDLVRGGCVSISTVAEAQIFYIPGRRRFTSDYYKNFTIHLFLPHAMFALLELMEGCVRVDNLSALHALFEYDYILPLASAFIAQCKTLLEALAREDIIRRSNDSYNFVSTQPGLFVPTVLAAPIQTMLWVRQFLCSARHVIEEDDSDKGALRTYAYGPFLESLQSEFRAAGYFGAFRRTEAATRSALTTALESLNQRQIVSLHDTGGQRDRIAVLKESDDEIAFLEKAQEALLNWNEHMAIELSRAMFRSRSGKKDALGDSSGTSRARPRALNH